MTQKIKHTPEPWRRVSALTPRGTTVTDIFTGDIIIAQFKNDEGRANAARIVACVNACAGATNEELQSLPYQQLKQERDELRARVAQLEEQLKRGSL